MIPTTGKILIGDVELRDKVPSSRSLDRFMSMNANIERFLDDKEMETTALGH